jgi:hypothetical protein
MITRSMLEERKDKLIMSFYQLQGAIDCLTELLEADASDVEITDEQDSEIEEVQYGDCDAG